MTLGPRVKSFQVGWTKGPRVAESPTACPPGPALEVDSGMLWDPPAPLQAGKHLLVQLPGSSF